MNERLSDVKEVSGFFTRAGLFDWLKVVSGALFGCILTPGCINPALTRLPVLAPSHPAVEKRSFERHDPFPSERLGPDTEARPPAFDKSRSEPRKALEEDLFQGRLAPGQAPQGGRDPNYPGVVRQ